MQKDDTPKRGWYVIHTYSGYENKVKANLEHKIASHSLGNMIFDIVVPMTNATVLDKDGSEKIVQKKLFPGYLLIDMIVDENTWYVVRNTQGVTGFVGSEKHPIPLTDEERERILNASSETEKTSFEVGDQVRITSEWMEDYIATVQAVDEENQSVRVLVKDKPVDLDFDQVEKI